jgi:hypothetical protein
MLIPDGNTIKFPVEINRLAFGQFGYTWLWNSEARFVVVGAKEFSMSQQTEIFNILSKFRINNCIIVSREHYLIENGYSKPINVKQVDRYMKLGV